MKALLNIGTAQYRGKTTRCKIIEILLSIITGQSSSSCSAIMPCTQALPQFTRGHILVAFYHTKHVVLLPTCTAVPK